MTFRKKVTKCGNMETSIKKIRKRLEQEDEEITKFILWSITIQKVFYIQCKILLRNYFKNNMIYFSFILYKSLIILVPKLIFNSFFILMIIIYHGFLNLFYQAIYEEYIKFHDRTNIIIQTHKNPINNHYIHVPLDYKIYDLKVTILNIIYYICICILPFICLRFSRLGNEVNLTTYFSTLSHRPLFVIIIIITIIMHLVFFFTIFWLNIYSRFYKEMKKLYIYLMQFGGCLDNINIFKTKEPYIFTYFLNPINRITYKKINLTLYSIIEKLKINKRKNKYLLNKSLTLFIIKLLEEFKLWIPLLYKWFFYVIIIIIILFEIYHNNLILKKTFYVLFILFFYKQLYNLFYFSWYHNLSFDKTLALYYYKLNDMIENKDQKYSKVLQLFYISGATYEQNDRLLYYLNTGLNLNQADAYRNKKEWPEYPTCYKKIICYFKNWYKSVYKLIK